MNKPPPRQTRTVTVSPTGELAGLQVVGCHGEVDAKHTPARRAPVLVDEHRALVRLTEVDAEPLRVQVEPGPLHVEAEPRPLPGVGTRLGPWPAHWGYFVRNK